MGQPTIFVEAIIEPSVAIAILFAIFIVSVVDLLFIAAIIVYIIKYLLPRTREPGNASIGQVFKRFNAMNWISLSLELFDIGTDILFSLSLILPSDNADNDDLFLMGCVSMLVTIFGIVLFFLKYSTHRKLIAFQVNELKEDWRNTQDATVKNNIMEKIRVRVTDMDILSFLICCIEDIPQIALVLMVSSLSDNDWKTASVLTLAVSVTSCLLKIGQIIVAKCGCKDVHISDTNQAVHVPNNSAIPQTNQAGTIQMADPDSSD